MRIFIAATLAAGLVASAAFADPPLAPGKPAGLKKAQDDDHTVLYVVGGGIVVLGAVLIATGDNDGTLVTGTLSTTSSTTST
jgi:hypothetical protein